MGSLEPMVAYTDTTEPKISLELEVITVTAAPTACNCWLKLPEWQKMARLCIDLALIHF